MSNLTEELKKLEKIPPKVEVKIKKIDPRAVIPSYKHHGDVGMDLTAIDVEYDAEHDMYIYHTGLAFETDFNFGQFLFPRSSNCRTDAYLCNHVGIADSAIYRGEIKLCFKNRDSINSIAEQEGLKEAMMYLNQSSVTQEYIGGWINSATQYYLKAKNKVFEDAKKLKYAPYQIGERIAQMVFFNYPDVVLNEVEELSETDRGCGGFGSTGK